ncbi:hypothetical protein BpHYR1_003272 [Brachionus plicatilis]|uniref:Uncharacterized protein n=1 Tax=Brachionus plicatilis TaxID=10195 RepID=A0A3M7RAW6_BRAPC|nr:hypothetical protein BpHYR1_003272 [Brachionus plicatilis]
MNDEYKYFILERVAEFFDKKSSGANISFSRQATLKIYENIPPKMKAEKEIINNFNNLKLKIELKKESLKHNVDEYFNYLIEQCQRIQNNCLNELAISKFDPESIERINNSPSLIESKFDQIDLGLKEIFGEINFCDKHSREFFKVPNLELLKQKFVIDAHKFNVLSIKFSEEKIVSSGADFLVKVWDQKANFSLKKSIKIDSLVKLFDVYESELTIGCKNGIILIYDLNDGQLKNKINGSQRPVTSILNIDKETLVIGDEDGLIRVINKVNKCLILAKNAHKKSVLCLRLVNSEEILSGSSDKHIRLWNLKSGECLRSFDLHDYAVYCIEILDDKRFISCSWDKSIKIWDKLTGSCIKSLEGHKGPVRWIELLDNEEILSCSDDGTIKHWVDGKCHSTLIVNCGPLNCFKILKNGQILIGCMNGSIRIWK